MREKLTTKEKAVLTMALENKKRKQKVLKNINPVKMKKLAELYPVSFKKPSER